MLKSLCVAFLLLFGLACNGEDRPPDGSRPEQEEVTEAAGPVDGSSRQDTKTHPRGIPSSGRWKKHPKFSRDNEQLTPEQKARIEALNAIGYASGSRSAPSKNVTVHLKDKTEAGLNFYTSGHGPEAALIDMKGRVLYRWRHDFWDVWPDYPETPAKASGWWRRAHLFENGDILAIFAGLGMIKLDKDSKLLWSHMGGEHHDLEVTADGDIYILERHAHMMPRIHESEPILEDFLVVLDRDGNEKKRLSLIEAFENSEFKHLIFEGKRNSGDIFHTNSVELLDGRIADRVPAFAKGNVLTSMNALGVIAVVDLEEEKVVWAHKENFERGVHDPRVLQNGNLIFFDNLRERSKSAVIEANPETMETVWEYKGTDGHPFLSLTCGTAQRLPNGNTLISESDGGRAFEVTPDKQIVWEFYNPNTAGKDDRFIATLFELVRLPKAFPTGWIKDGRGK